MILQLNKLTKVFFSVITLSLSLGFYPAYSSNLKLEQAVGQMMMVGFNGVNIDENSPIVKAIKNYHIGGVILNDHYNHNGFKITRNIQNPTQLKNLIAKLQYYAKKYNSHPLLIAVNQEGGLINALKHTKGFANEHDPSQAQLGKINDTKLIFATTLQRALLLKKMGINVDFAPVADLNLNTNNPAIGKLERSFGDNPANVTKALLAAIRAYQKAGILCTLKHFPGFGSAQENTDFFSVDVTHTWQAKELISYKKLIQLGKACPLIMTSHLINKNLEPSGLPVSFSKKVVTDLLIHQLKFSGLIITDDMDAHAITNNFSFKKALKNVVLAGNHIIIYDGTQGHSADEDTVKLFSTLMELAEKNPEIRNKVMSANTKIRSFKKKYLAIKD